jgi:hypothetical protein
VLKIAAEMTTRITPSTCRAGSAGCIVIFISSLIANQVYQTC